LNIWAFESYNSFFTEDFWANFWNAIVEPADDNAAREARNNANEGNETSGKSSWQGKAGRVAQFFSVWRSVIVDWEWEYVDRVTLLDEFSRPIARQVASALVGSTICWQIIIQIAPSVLQAGNGGFMVPLFGQVEYGIFRMGIFRLCAVGHVGVQLCTAHRRRIEQWFRVAHDAARDDRYLVGEILMAFDPSPNN
jgi:E3 ubiquitin-protein ligase MARCH6